MSVLKINSLYKRFGKKEVVRGVDFSMETGEVLGLLGPNGAGKSTLSHVLTGKKGYNITREAPEW